MKAESGGGDLLGLAFVGSVCSDMKYSIVEEWGGFTGMVVKNT